MIKQIYKEFLQLTGFEEEEIPQYLPEWIAVTKKLGLTEDDVRFAVKEWIPGHWNVKLAGVRKCIGAFIREVIDIAKIHDYKRRGVKIVYGCLPANPVNFQAMKISGGEGVFVSFPDIHIITVLGSFFHKSFLLMEKAEKSCTEFGCSHCGLNKTRFSSRMTRLIPSPDVIWSWAFNCNEASKMDEMIKCCLDPEWKSVFCSVPHDTYWGEAEDEMPERVGYIAEQIRDGQKQIEEITGIMVEEAHLRQALEDYGRFIRKVHYLNEIVSRSDPQPLSGNELNLFSQGMTVAFNTGMKYLEEAIDIITGEVLNLVACGKGLLSPGAPRLGCYFVPFCVPWINTLFLKNGVNLYFFTAGAMTDKLLKKSRYRDPFMVIAEQWLKMPGGVNIKYDIERTYRLIKRIKPDAVLLGFNDFDRWVSVHHKITAGIIEEKLKIPHFYLECNIWDDRIFKPDDLKARIESICFFVKMNKMISANHGDEQKCQERK